MACREDDTDALRFLWWGAGLDKPASDYKMTVHLLGKADLAYIAAWALQRTVADNEAAFGEEIREIVTKISMRTMACSRSRRPNRQCVHHWNR